MQRKLRLSLSIDTAFIKEQLSSFALKKKNRQSRHDKDLQQLLRDALKRFMRGDNAGALELYSHALELNPASFQGHSCRAYCYKEMGKYSEAIDDFSAAISLLLDFGGTGSPAPAADYTAVTAVTMTATADSSSSASTGRASFGTDASEQWAELPLLLLDRAECYFRMDKAQSALRDLNQAVTFKAAFTDALYLRAIVHYKLSQYRDAIHDFEQCLLHTPDDMELRKQLDIVRRCHTAAFSARLPSIKDSPSRFDALFENLTTWSNASPSVKSSASSSSSSDAL